MNEFDTVINTQLAQLTPEYRDFVEGQFLTALAQIFGPSVGIVDSKIADFEADLFLYCIFLSSREELLDNLITNYQIPHEQAESLLVAMEKVLPTEIVEAAATIAYGASKNFQTDSVSNPSTNEIVDTQIEQMNTVRTPVPQPVRTSALTAAATTGIDLSAEIAAAEAALHEVQPMRTMNHDMELTRGTLGESTPPAQAAQTPAATPPATSVAAAAADRIPTPGELIKPGTDPHNLVADGPGNQVQNHDAAWGNTQ